MGQGVLKELPKVLEPLSGKKVYMLSENPTFEAAGDRVLSHAAGLISGTIRSHDLAGRVGGEEFCIVLPGTTLVQAAQIAERIRQRVNDKEILIAKGTTLRISASLGVSGAQENGDYDFEQLQSLADRRLYLAKQAGRNQVCVRDDHPAPSPDTR